MVEDEVVSRAIFTASFEFLQLLYCSAFFSRTMKLQPVTTGEGDANAFAQRGTRCLVRLMRGQLTAHALNSLTVCDPSDGFCICCWTSPRQSKRRCSTPAVFPHGAHSRTSACRRRRSRGLRAPQQRRGSIFRLRRSTSFTARVHALRVPQSSSILLGGDDLVANETPGTAPLVRHRYTLGGAGASVDMADIVGSSDTFAPRGAPACMCGPRHTANARGSMLRLGQRVLLAAYSADQASSEMHDEHGSAVGGII